MEVVFFPRNDYPSNIEVCDHRLGKKMTYTENTDVLPTLVSQYILPLAVERGIKTSAFVDYESPDSPYGTNMDANNGYPMQQWRDGLLWCDNYFFPHPANDFSQAAVEDGYYNYHLPWFVNRFGKKPVALAYSNGETSYSEYLKPFFLGGRNSGYNGTTEYGLGLGTPNDMPYSLNRYISKWGTFRWWDKARQNGDNFSTQIAEVAAKIDETLLNGGWINNFGHWHEVVYLDIDKNTGEVKEGRESLPSISAYNDYFSMLAQKNANDEIYFAGYGEAVAYLVYRQLITKAVMYSPNAHHNEQLVIRLEAKNTLNIDTDLLQVPISVKFSTVGTPLEGQSIKSSSNLISLGSNQYIVEIPYSEYAGAIIEKVSI